MAIDGSFRLESAVDRFLARCPQLGRYPQLDSLAKKGDMVTEEEVVKVVADIFLHPNYTIPLIGCFRPIARKIVDKVVAMLHLVGNLGSSSDYIILLSDNSDDKLTLDNAMGQGVSVIDFYHQQGRSLHLHECACLAFCRALDLAPFLSGSVLTYFKFAPPPYERIANQEAICKMSRKVVASCLHVVHISYRFLMMEPEVFCELWDWSCFLDLVRKTLDMGSHLEFAKDISDVRWCAVQVLSIILRMNDRATASLGVGAEEALSCLLRWEEFCEDVAVEKAGMYIGSSDCTTMGSAVGQTEFSRVNCLQSFSTNSLVLSQLDGIEPSMKRRRLVKREDRSYGDPFVMTSTIKKSFEMALLAVSQNWPVLFYGPAGCGKSALIRKLAEETGNNVLSIHMDDQIDGKMLVGSYICTEQPGEFRWQPGSLTQAVLNGLWVVFENIDKAPSDVLPILVPLLEGASSFVTSHGEVIRVAESFRLFSTISTSKCDIVPNTEGGNALGGPWRKIMIGSSNNEDLQNIVEAWYPKLVPVAKRLVETFENVSSPPLPQVRSFQLGTSSLSGSLNRFSLRDLLKWCKRVDGLHMFNNHRIYQEAVDIFAAFSMSSENRVITMKEIAKMWNIPESEALNIHQYKPTIQDFSEGLKIGRVTLHRAKTASYDPSMFVEIRSSLYVLERIARSVEYNEPVLLVGETGIGKTTLVQNLATWLCQKLTVLNLSQQSDVADLLGGFKPMDARCMCVSLYNEFEDLAIKTFSLKDGNKALPWLRKLLVDKRWKTLLKGLGKYIEVYKRKAEEERSGSLKKRRKHFDVEEKLKAWESFSVRLENTYQQIASTGMFFSFVEGAFVTALRNGEWILLDEVNLAPPEILGRIIGVLEGKDKSLCLAERGDVEGINRHPSFRIFACMNPATDAGKRELPYSLRSRFTEYFVDDMLDDSDLDLFVRKFLGGHQSDKLVERIVSFYKEAKKESEQRLQDGANQKPQYSLRSLYRALEYVRKAERTFGFQRTIYDGFSMFFLSLLDGSSAKIMNNLIVKLLLEKDDPPPQPTSFSSYLIEKENARSDDFVKNYVLTKSVNGHLRNLARAIFVKRYPVLLQGPTSSGKTSLVRYLAAITGHEFVRINNHEHTDIQEYLGSYITDSSGKLVFHEGVLVKAVRNGHWIVLDELNLAPSDVLEALNRLLDDNRELFVPELRETVRAHPNFMLFATQNPPTFYGGRKLLSRAFRNRFVEIHVGEIPEDELSIILEQRCQIPKSYALKMVEVMKELQLHRQSSKIFAGKHGYITPRDLFRWANRFKALGKSYEDLANDGYYLLAERLRDEGEKLVVQEVLEKYLRVKLVKDNMYKQDMSVGDLVFTLQEHSRISWTKSLWRLYFLIKRCYDLREPVLLVGETGGGKTTVCQLLAEALGLRLHILNCHQYTETSEFLGGFYPVRDRSQLSSEFQDLIGKLRLSKAFVHLAKHHEISSDIGLAASTLNHLEEIIKMHRQGLVSCADITIQDIDTLEEVKQDLLRLHQKWQAIFVWQDGPLVQSMRAGDLFLVDEISLADDSVLERLNSVLETERKLSLAEKGGTLLEEVTAHGNFLVLATMNPGGDYGKKELSPALRNRFTEIWVPFVNDRDELKSIALQGFSDPKISHVVDPMLNFWEWFNQLQIGRMLTVRDLLSWVSFINATEESLGLDYAFLHGAFLVLLDGLSLGTGISRDDGEHLREKCFSFLLELLKVDDTNTLYAKLSSMENYGWGDQITASRSDDIVHDKLFGINPFYIEKGDENCDVDGFEFWAPTTCRNALRVLRAMQLQKPVLLEGSPGVGKTSLIVALGKYSGHKVIRINLSEQTDIMDLLGSDLPVESNEGMKFAWSDGILLQALKQGSWVLLDELNLAPQSVLEGLNSILDHRAEVFIPELGLTFKCPPSFRVFACQNPSSQGGGRKGLPKSFLNRFTKVYINELVEDDYVYICGSLFPSIPKSVLLKVISFNRRLHEDTMLHHKFAQNGSPWEFNLRDVIRSCQLIKGTSNELNTDSFLNILYIQRMRSAADRREVVQLYEHVFARKPSIIPDPRVQVNSHYLIVGNAAIRRNHTQPLKISPSQLKIVPEIRHSLEAAAHCIRNNWLCILIGPPSSGKTSLIRILAQLTGNVLHELNLSCATDISELLGCFEQYNAFRNFCSVVAQVKLFVNEYCNLQFESSMEALLLERRDLVSRWLTFSSKVDSSFMSRSPSSYAEKWKTIINSLSFLVEIIEHLKQDLERDGLPVSWSSKDLERTMKAILKLQDYQKRPYSANFEWVKGSLIKAIENGEWLVLENANLCNPTVLDRINSLVEPCGTITVSECGIVDGKPVVVHPHSNFRLFFTINPEFGEVSRAMRNRGVEIYMMEPYWLFEEGSFHSCEELELRDIKRFLILSGIPSSKLVESMARAHINARHEGLHLNVKITYLELTHWIQLFQQLIMNGNQPIWSLQISWEHTYISSLGENSGRNIINHARQMYLSDIQLSESDSLLERALYLPGGWPRPLQLKDYVCYAKEATIKQNCMYLEFLGAQHLSHEFRIVNNCCSVDQHLATSDCSRAYLLDSEILGKIVFPKVAGRKTLDSNRNIESRLKLSNKMILSAANWIIEQARADDFQLYLSWFNWLVSKLQPYCQCIDFFLTALKEEMNHPIWNHIFSCHKELISLHKIDLDMHPIPVLSSELVELTSSNDVSSVSTERLLQAINCVGVLRLSYEQWHAEYRHNYADETRCFIPFLKSLRTLEEAVLNMIVGSPSFDMLIQLYTNFFEDHMLFWSSLITSQFEWMLVSCRSLVKAATKLQSFCLIEASVVLMESKNLSRMSPCYFHSERPLLWLHGGHPVLPASAKLFNQQQQLLKLCDSVWPIKSKSWKQAKDCFTKVVASSDLGLRALALQGVCMSSYIMGEYEEDDLGVVTQVEEMYQMLLRRLEYGQCKLEARLNSDEHTTSEPACCIFCPETLCIKSGFDSWLDTLPIIDSASCFLDMELLQLFQELLVILIVEPGSLQPALSNASSLLEPALKYLLSSMRPPQSLIPHQKILWIIDAWTAVNAANKKFAGFVLEMWYWWHSFLWNHCLFPFMDFSKNIAYGIPLPDILSQPVKTATVAQILQSSFLIKNYCTQALEIRVASLDIWRSPVPRTNIPTFLLLSARSLLQQIIYAHKKSFTDDDFVAIKSRFNSSSESMHALDNIQILISLIGASSHQKLKSLMNSFIEPLLKHLYLNCSSTDFYSNLGFAWLQIGGLRFHLLLTSDDLDPAMKYLCKYSHLEEKISSLQLEIQVRQECKHIAGWSYWEKADKRMTEALQKLEIERKRLRRKIVFRPDLIKFKSLRKECEEFLTFINHSMSLVNNIGVTDLQQVVEQVHNWQDTATCFIDRLSSVYAEYVDISQPVQVAVYEMKLGLSLILSGLLLKNFLNRIEEDNIDLILGVIYALMRFPRGCPSDSIPVNLKSRPLVVSSHDRDSPMNACSLDIGLLEKLVVVSNEANAEKISLLQLKAALYQNLLVRVAHDIANSRLMKTKSFQLLDKIFFEFANIWMKMKVQVKSKEEWNPQLYKFRTRAFKIENVMEFTAHPLGLSVASDTYLEWQEFMAEEESNEKMRDCVDGASLEEEWDLMEEPLNDLVNIHNQLFGSINLVQNPGMFQISNADRLDSFINSYTLGSGMIKGIGGLFTSVLDAKLAPEHLLRLCLEHEKKFVSSHTDVHRFNFYKDSNAPLLSKMVQSLTDLQQRICTLLREWDDDSGLQQILDVIVMLLDIPLSTPLAKALSGLQFLLNRVRILQERGCKLSISDQLEPIVSLVCSWQRMEFECWPALLDEVQARYERNAGKLWFPLFSILYRGQTDDPVGYDKSTTENLVEFIQTSSVGEFRKRLQLLFSFLGQMSIGSSLGTYSSPWQQKSVNILYNVFGFYIQFLPTVMEQIEAIRTKIEIKLKELVRLCRWERSENYLSIDYTKRSRQKLKKLIQKYSDMLEQPVIFILSQGAVERKVEIMSFRSPESLNDTSDKSLRTLNSILDLKQFSAEDRCSWFGSWGKKVSETLQNVDIGKRSQIFFLNAEDVANIDRLCLDCQPACPSSQEEWKKMWYTLERISRTIISCGDLWKDLTRSLGKKRALSELLKLLESSGLHRNKFENVEISSLFVQPTYSLQHLLLTQSRLLYVASAAHDTKYLSNEDSESEWKTANEFYFKSLASMQLLQQICLRRHGDFTSEQVNRSVSFLSHLVAIQQMQRAAAYEFAEQLKSLRGYVSAMEDLLSASTDTDARTEVMCSVAQNQHDTFMCLWQQKQLFDRFGAMLLEESLLLRSFERTHLNSCKNAKAADSFLALIEKFIPVIQKSKESLDTYLLGCNEAITNLTSCVHPYIISKQMEQLLFQNLDVIKEFEDDLSTFRKKDHEKNSVIETFLNHFNEMLNEGKLMAEKLNPALDARNKPKISCQDPTFPENLSEVEAEFGGAIGETYEDILDVLQKLGSSCNGHSFSKELLGNVTAWGALFKSTVADFRVDELCNKLLKLICLTEKLLNHFGQNVPTLSSRIGACLKYLLAFLNLILSFADCFLQDFLVMVKTVSVMTHALANILASLYSKGFGTSAKDHDDVSVPDGSQLASGTGMGEGSGLKDVSDQITDEDQLLGTSEKDGEEQDASNEVPSKNDKGIEMENDFTVDALSVSEDSSEDDNEEAEDEQLDSAMGETGANAEAVGEKLWDAHEDENPENSNEKYESGPAVTDKDASSRELRAKEDRTADADDSGDPCSDKLNESSDEIGDQDDLDNEENVEDMNLSKEKAFADPTGLKLDELDVMQNEDVDNEEEEDMEQESVPEEPGESVENEKIEGGTENPADELMEPETEDVPGVPEEDISSRDYEDKSEMNLMETSKNMSELKISESTDDGLSNIDSATQANTKDVQNDLGLPTSLPSSNTLKMDMTVSNFLNGERLTDHQPGTPLPQNESSSIQKKQTNPYRSVGDALKEWKERVKVHAGFHEDETDTEGKVDDMNADEYAYVSEFEKGTCQARGPATPEQIDSNLSGNKPNEENSAAYKDEATEMEVENTNSVEQAAEQCAPLLKNSISEKLQMPDVENTSKEGTETYSFDDGGVGKLSESLISIRKSYLNEDINQLSKLSVNDNKLGKFQDINEIPDDLRNRATILWRKYELLTTKLSHELAEQLRLIMEPTLASKLRGDYRTGKRINMKKVIPYIASHYRKDKIWLRRTKPNKHDYQVVIAVDDSRSMSESSCGEVAIKALVTVCRAMSQMEVGNLAVASFGKKGNIRLLHDFDQPFSGEAGIKIISSLTFKQENTIEDEPVVDLLIYLDNMLDAAVAKARLPSGQNPLQQLVLIIGDGRFHEKEKLKRCVRDVLSKKRMVAFLLLDNLEESIVDLKELTMESGVVKFSKYLDSFPFPYYIVLRNIEALPRTLADLLRQWFELMRNSRD